MAVTVVAAFKIFLLGFLYAASTCNAACLCASFLASNAQVPSGIYSVPTPTGRLVTVYCEMGLGGGGYTFITPLTLSLLNDAGLSTWFNNRTTFLLRVRKTDGTQPYAVLRQLPQYSSIPLKLGLGQYTGYNAPVNLATLGNLFLYFGFLPTANASNNNVQGLMVNSYSNTFTNCDRNPNSHFTLFSNFREAQPSTYNVPGPFCDRIFSNLLPNPSQRVMPPDIFFFGETHWGGCGCYQQSNQIAGITGFNIGFK